MKPQTKNIYLLVIGIFFIVFSIFSYLINIYYGRWYELFWFCYLSLFLAGLGALIRKGSLVLAQINILFIVDIFWNIDYFFFLFSGHSLMGIIDYVTLEKVFLFRIVSFQHIFFLPLALVCLYYIKSERKDAWMISFIQVIIMFPLTYIFSPIKENVNCVFRSCININWPVPYFLAWLFCFSFIILLSNFIFVYLFSKQFVKKIRIIKTDKVNL